MMRNFFIIWVFLGVPLFGITDEALLRVSQSRAWHRLLHYKRSLPFLTLRSELDGPGFFFSPEGKTDPLAELKASMSAFGKEIEVGTHKLRPHCAFPARFEFLQKTFGLERPKEKCEKFEEVLATAAPSSATLVFSSAYPNNPASMFGHTFLRLNRKNSSKEKKQDMLDYGVSFAANVSEDENPLAFIAFGLTGGYRGRFSYVPYYVKVNEYNNSESRDVWEYDLSLSPDETRFLLAHIWEIEMNSHFDYYFFDENCSYQMLTAIEAAKPEWDLSNFIVSVIPSETIKKIIEVPGAVTQVRYRPSLRQKMVHKMENLGNTQRKDLKALFQRKKAPSEIQDPFVLDAAVASLFYEKNEREGELDQNKKEMQAGLLIQRSKLGKTQNTDLEIKHEEGQPDLGHYANRFSFSPGYLSTASFNGGFQELGIKSAYHDLLNKDLGFLRYSHIDFPQIYFRYFPKENSLQLENMELLHITSLFPLSFFEKRPSWKLQVGYANSRDSSCAFCKSFAVRGGLGASVNLLSERHIAYALLLARAEMGSHLSRGYRLGPEAQLAVIFNPIENYKTRFFVSATWDLIQKPERSWLYQAEWEHALSLNQSWEARASFGFWSNTSQQGSVPYQEGKFSLNYYF